MAPNVSDSVVCSNAFCDQAFSFSYCEHDICLHNTMAPGSALLSYILHLVQYVLCSFLRGRCKRIFSV